MPIIKGYRQLVDAAMAQVHPRTVPEVLALLNDPRVQIVDSRELIKGG